MSIRDRFAASPAREGIFVWAAILAVLAICKLTIGQISWGGQVTGALAVGLFLWTPSEVNERMGRSEDDGLTSKFWRQDLRLAAAAMAIVFPLFIGGFMAFLWSMNHLLPLSLVSIITPYIKLPQFHLRAPASPFDVVGGNLAIALAEEFFYRGYLLKRFSERWPPTARVLGVPFGRAMLTQTGFFAAGHLLTPQVYRLATFFPGLLFGWLAARSGRIVAPAIVHWGSNVLIAVLEASAFS